MTTKGKCPVVGMVHPQCDFRDEKCPIHGNMKRPSPAPRQTTGDLWSVYEGDTLLHAGEDRQRAFLLFGEAFHRRKEHVRLFRGTEVYAEGYSLKPKGG